MLVPVNRNQIKLSSNVSWVSKLPKQIHHQYASTWKQMSINIESNLVTITAA